MPITRESVVLFHYRLLDEDENVLEDSHQGNPMAYLHGAGNIFPLMEKAMTDHEVGDSFSVTLPPEEAYGPRVGDAIRRISRKHIRTSGKINPGMVINVETDNGLRQVVVIKAGKFVVDVDTNHPLAGLTLRFDIEIVDIRQATDEERSHGHAHGAGGHQH